MRPFVSLDPNRWAIPRYVILTSGIANGYTELTAFDKALLNAGIGNLNLVRVTSVLPPNGTVLRLTECKLELPRGALIPTVYARNIDATKGIIISSAIGVGIPEDSAVNGMIFEASISGPKNRAMKLVEQMITEAFAARQTTLRECVIVASEMESTGDIACTLAAALLL